MTTYTVNNTEQEQKLYAGREYEIDLTTNTQYNYIYVGDMPIALYVQGDTNAMYTLHTNYIGSIEKISDHAGNVVDSMSYTPFGQRRLFSDWSKTDTSTHLIDRGFTGQQHLDNFALINFNGRMYDPVLAHFLSPDPYIQSPENPLNHNRYSYCLFSPLQYVDPSGELIWKPDKYGNLIADENDNAVTLSEYLDISFEKAISIFSNLRNWDDGDSYKTGIINIKGHKLTINDIYLKIGNIAEYYANIGSKAWNYDTKKDDYPSGTNKCNIFCADVINAAGASLPTPNIINPIASKIPFINKKYGPPFAGQWADPNYDIPNWRVLNANEVPRRGDIAAYQYNYSDASGHMAIVTQNGYTVGTSSRYNKISKTNFGFDPLLNNGQQIIFRRYIGK